MGCTSSTGNEKEKQVDAAKKLITTTQHFKESPQEISASLSSDLSKGVTEKEAKERNQKDGPNCFSKNLWKRETARLKPQTAVVIREGAQKQIPSDKLVVGDIVLIMEGYVPADIQILEGSAQVDEKMVGGQPEPRELSPGFSGTVSIDSKNLVFFGTKVLSGKGKGIVFAIGDDTRLGVMMQTVKQSKIKMGQRI
jgi:magnesium-transporting ATPase (P-type)